MYGKVDLRARKWNKYIALCSVWSTILYTIWHALWHDMTYIIMPWCDMWYMGLCKCARSWCHNCATYSLNGVQKCCTLRCRSCTPCVTSKYTSDVTFVAQLYTSGSHVSSKFISCVHISCDTTYHKAPFIWSQHWTTCVHSESYNLNSDVTQFNTTCNATLCRFMSHLYTYICVIHRSFVALHQSEGEETGER